MLPENKILLLKMLSISTKTNVLKWNNEGVNCFSSTVPNVNNKILVDKFFSSANGVVTTACYNLIVVDIKGNIIDEINLCDTDGTDYNLISDLYIEILTQQRNITQKESSPIIDEMNKSFQKLGFYGQYK